MRWNCLREVLNTQEARDKAALYTAYVDDTIAPGTGICKVSSQR